jgi:septum formation protein
MARFVSQQAPLILGSASPRRRDLLAGLGLPFVVRPPDICEDRASKEAPNEYVERMACEKLLALASTPKGQGGSALLTADTTVVIDGDVLGKPSDTREAFELLRRISGREHRVHTAYAIAHGDRPDRVVRLRRVESSVFLRQASDEELHRYAETGEGLDKAGAYAVQGIGAFLVERIDGSYTNVVGLPVCEMVVDFRDLGLLESFP